MMQDINSHSFVVPTVPSISNVAKALNAAQIKFKPAIKSADNPFFKSKYADLAAIWDSVKEPLSSNGLAILQTMDFINGETILVTMLLHTSGESITGRVRVKPTKDDPQSWGSAITYFRRYSLAAILGVVTEDDDGAQASDTKTTHLGPTQSAPSSPFIDNEFESFAIPVGRDKGMPISTLSNKQIMENLGYWKPRLDADRANGKTVSSFISNYMMALEGALENRIANDEQDITI